MITNKSVVFSVADLLALRYSPEQQVAIDTAVAEAVDDSFVEYFRSERFVQRGNQTFAVFGHEARELLPFCDAEDERARYEYLPVVIDGQMILQAPDEGNSGMLYLMRCTKRRGQPYSGKWLTVWLGRSWLHTEELDMTNREISARIVEDIERGANVITTPPPGWA